MSITVIKSRDNSLLRLARAVRDGKEARMIFIEGLRLCEEAVRSGLELYALIYSDEIAAKERAAAFLRSVSNVVERRAAVTEQLLATISYTKTPQGIIALAARPRSERAVLEQPSVKEPLLVVMHRINNPVNVGAILRTAEAAGVTGVIATEHTSDPFSPKSLRGAMGSAFRLQIWSGAGYKEALDWCAQRKIKTFCADLAGSKSFTEVEWRGPRALILGPEASGLTAEEVAAANDAVRIPMQGDVESLNVSVAAGILLYEAARQRTK
jgi:TrmH family RNA methyltransferase